MPPKRPNATAQTAYGARVLQIVPETKGLDVWELQIKLLAWGSGSDCDGIGNILDPVRVTGTFDTTTRDAVMRFQKALNLPVTGVVNSATFQALDAEAALYAVLPHEMRCRCLVGANDGPILCRCEKHPDAGKCVTGFGRGRQDGKYLLDGTAHAGEKLDLYDMKEYNGMDKALLWAVRGLMRRAEVKRLAVVAGYCCWEDNYHQTDELRWRHRKLTFHFGKALEFYHDGKCVRTGANWKNDAVCDECEKIRKVALEKCGFQLGWQEPNRVSVAEGRKDAPPPMTPFSVHVNTVRRLGREDDDFVRTFFDSVQPIYAGHAGFAYPLDLGEGTDPRVAGNEKFFTNTEAGPGGWFPMGASRIWHGGIHLHVKEGTEIRALADGEVIGCRITESATAKPYGSRNFVLIRHQFNNKKYYSFYYHLSPQPESDAADSKKTTPWRHQLYLQAKDHIEALAPCPFFIVEDIGGGKKRIKPAQQLGLAPGERALTTGGEIIPQTLDPLFAADSMLIKLSSPVDTYAFTRLENQPLAKQVAADASLAQKVREGKNAGLKNPIRVQAGEVMGKVGPVAGDAAAAKLGTFVHIELFSAEAFLTGSGWTRLELAGAGDLADRKALVAKLIDKKLLSPPPDKVLLAEDLNKEQDLYRELLRAVVLKMPSAWSVDWKTGLTTPACLSFIKRPTDLGDAFNDYAWWNDVKADGADLPASSTVFHYHPIAALLAMAYA
jgi:hypothetical protein